MSGVPTPVVSGHERRKNQGPLRFGTKTAWLLPEADAKAYFLSYGGDGLESLEKRQTAKEQHMAFLGAHMFDPPMLGKRGFQDATRQPV